MCRINFYLRILFNIDVTNWTMELGYLIIFCWKCYFEQKTVPHYGEIMTFYIFNYLYKNLENLSNTKMSILVIFSLFSSHVIFCRFSQEKDFFAGVMRVHKKQQIAKCTENALLKLKYKINIKFLRHVIEQFFVLNVILHRLKITLLDSHT